MLGDAEDLAWPKALGLLTHACAPSAEVAAAKAAVLWISPGLGREVRTFRVTPVGVEGLPPASLGLLEEKPIFLLDGLDCGDVTFGLMVRPSEPS
mmetsp:Transcript_73216/g.161637  ORF Transcript_73216/g.161637 Transcript_73216/m.161637 type:complete len:95 (+) Transcript_73216:172-456(+)